MFNLLVYHKSRIWILFIYIILFVYIVRFWPNPVFCQYIKIYFGPFTSWEILAQIYLGRYALHLRLKKQVIRAGLFWKEQNINDGLLHLHQGPS